MLSSRPSLFIIDAAMPLYHSAAAFLALVVVLLSATPAQAQSGMPRTELSAGMYRIEAEVAATQENRMTGLMQRRSMPANQGMLFVFTQPQRHCMWMKNTLLPLSVAFLDDEGRILNVEDMQPQTEDNHCAARPARFALEMNLGWFRQKGIRPGQKIDGVLRLTDLAR
jgi:uncharacterized membrane protein (UPF0127 family)